MSERLTFYRLWKEIYGVFMGSGVADLRQFMAFMGFMGFLNNTSKRG